MRHDVRWHGVLITPTYELTCRIMNISLGGAMLELATGWSHQELSALSGLRVKDAVRVGAELRWMSGLRCGVMFTGPAAQRIEPLLAGL